MSSVTPILETRDLTFGFGGNLVTDHVSMSVAEGEFVSIIGPNGAGKTTFFNVISGAYRPSAGAILYRGRDITGTSPAERARAGLARSFQLSTIFPTLTVLENARLAAQAQGPDSFQLLRPFTAYRRYIERAEAALELVGLRHRAWMPAISLSHGDKRKLELAMVIAMDPQILLLDEPTSGVSAEDVPAMVELISRIRQVEKKTVMMVEHKMGVVLRLSDRIAVLHQGRLLAFDTPEMIRQNETVQSAYLGKEQPGGTA
ncbi:MAG TPA: ABC transporter ATP-binding protein [Chloroflexota bacterium]|nr:ABC transporter ATP-binding protein [Chloroflexota bacterium]